MKFISLCTLFQINYLVCINQSTHSWLKSWKIKSLITHRVKICICTEISMCYMNWYYAPRVQTIFKLTIFTLCFICFFFQCLINKLPLHWFDQMLQNRGMQGWRNSLNFLDHVWKLNNFDWLNIPNSAYSVILCDAYYNLWLSV